MIYLLIMENSLEEVHMVDVTIKRHCNKYYITQKEGLDVFFPEKVNVVYNGDLEIFLAPAGTICNKNAYVLGLRGLILSPLDLEIYSNGFKTILKSIV